MRATVHARMHAPTPIHTYTHIHTHVHTYICTRTHTLLLTHTRLHTHTSAGIRNECFFFFISWHAYVWMFLYWSGINCTLCRVYYQITVNWRSTLPIFTVKLSLRLLSNSPWIYCKSPWIYWQTLLVFVVKLSFYLL